MPEGFARAILMAAIKENRSAELLECLFDGGSATVDNGTLVLATADMLDQFRGALPDHLRDALKAHADIAQHRAMTLDEARAAMARIAAGRPRSDPPATS